MVPSNYSYVRNEEDLKKIIQHAKLDENTILPITQALYIEDSVNDYKLLELDGELFNKINNGVSLCFRGEEDDKVVLCSDDKTYEVKEAETSNSLLVTQRLKFPEEIDKYSNSDRIIEHKNVISVFHTYFEVKLCKPKLGRLRTLLVESAYRGSELESELIESGVKMCTTEDLLNVVQASEIELQDALSKMEAFQLNDKWRILEFNYHVRVLNFFLNLIEEQSWRYNEIPPDEVVQILSDFIPPAIIKHTLSIYCEDNSVPEKKLVKLKEDKICRILGEELLKPTSRFELTAFLRTWQQCVPEGLNVNLSQLNGLVYVDGPLHQKIIHYCPEYKLPEDVAERIQHLFKLKEKWTFDEIKPYIEIFTTPKMDENAILTKYTRTSKADGVQMYSSRHGK